MTHAITIVSDPDLSERGLFIVQCTCSFIMSATTKQALYDATIEHFTYSPLCRLKKDVAHGF